jgi:hypothetical protein
MKDITINIFYNEAASEFTAVSPEIDSIEGFGSDIPDVLRNFADQLESSTDFIDEFSIDYEDN